MWLRIVKDWIAQFSVLEIIHIPRAEKEEADHIAQIAFGIDKDP